MTPAAKDLVAGLGSCRWETIPRLGTSATIRWVPIVLASTRDPSYLGLSDDGTWLVAVPDRHADDQRNGASTFTGSEPVVMPLLALLLRPPRQVRDEVADFTREHGLDADQLWDVIPWRAAIRFATRGGRDHWVTAALDWAEALDAVDDALAGLESPLIAPAYSEQTARRIDRLHRTHRGTDRDDRG